MGFSYHTLSREFPELWRGPAKWTCARNGLDSNSESMRSFQYIAAALIVVGAILALTHQQEVIEMVRPIINSIRASF